ncbi:MULTISPECIES: hypothetical protein [unclassified Sphingomonas]|uniref:hypothetical protein n=1 Tax=unclassified Sphingomonas TaxID=196159 RepID=UPI00070154EC|nr:MULTISPECIES: hypothetical protein [unclassified Sphingomonas]KQX18396.1 hypothetical protein ASD17_14640 [Sphingomonas sp. Root1294]KQY72279.1 hypothetical protein ASD39_20335 [Sphingomonas sp. Root50]KRB94450.1 hypothetical protein ASE22_00415 [Sphingomonas sp. Root720]
MIGGSVQLRSYRRARRDGLATEEAATLAGISIGEARLHDQDDAKNPPPPEAYEPIPAPAGTAGTITEEPEMARPKKQSGTVNGEVPKPDPALAVKIYREDIKPAQARVGEYAQEQSTAYKAIKKQAHIQPQAAKLAFKLDGMEESKRDDYLRCLRGLLTELKIFMPSDLVDAAEGKSTGGDVIPTGERPRPKLATVGGTAHPIDDSDLAGGDEPKASADEDEAWVVFDPEAQLYIDQTGKDWSAFADCGRFTKARAQEIIDSFGDDADGLQIVDSAGPLPGPLVSEAAE